MYAISSAGVAFAVTRACSSGELDKCGCDRTVHGGSAQGTYVQEQDERGEGRAEPARPCLGLPWAESRAPRDLSGSCRLLEERAEEQRQMHKDLPFSGPHYLSPPVTRHEMHKQTLHQPGHALPERSPYDRRTPGVHLSKELQLHGCTHVCLGSVRMARLCKDAVRPAQGHSPGSCFRVGMETTTH